MGNVLFISSRQPVPLLIEHVVNPCNPSLADMSYTIGDPCVARDTC